MAITVASVQTFTDAELLILWRNAYALCSLGQSYRIGGRELTRADVKEIREQIDWLEQRVQAASDAANGGGNVLVRFGDPA